jgi:hypothetical protein
MMTIRCRTYAVVRLRTYGSKGMAHSGGGVVVGNLEDAEAELRHPRTIVEDDGGDGRSDGG